jgi:hypothetical protein
MNRAVFCVALAAMFVLSASASEKAKDEALSQLLPKWVNAWNNSDIAGLMALQHPDSLLLRDYGSAGAKAKIDGQLKQIITTFGQIKSAVIGKFIQRKDRYVVKIEYAGKGLVPGTMAVKQGKDGTWLISDVNLDGQSEPELKE